MTEYPCGLPGVLRRGYGYAPKPVVTRTPIAQGPGIYTPHDSGGWMAFNVSWLYNARDMQTFRNWFRQTTRGGALPFTIDLPIDGRDNYPHTCYFDPAGKYKAVQVGALWRVTATLLSPRVEGLLSECDAASLIAIMSSFRGPVDLDLGGAEPPGTPCKQYECDALLEVFSTYIGSSSFGQWPLFDPDVGNMPTRLIKSGGGVLDLQLMPSNPGSGYDTNPAIYGYSKQLVTTLDTCGNYCLGNYDRASPPDRTIDLENESTLWGVSMPSVAFSVMLNSVGNAFTIFSTTTAVYFTNEAQNQQAGGEAISVAIDNNYYFNPKYAIKFLALGVSWNATLPSENIGNKLLIVRIGSSNLRYQLTDGFAYSKTSWDGIHDVSIEYSFVNPDGSIHAEGANQWLDQRFVQTFNNVNDSNAPLLDSHKLQSTVGDSLSFLLPSQGGAYAYDLSMNLGISDRSATGTISGANGFPDFPSNEEIISGMLQNQTDYIDPNPDCG